MKQHLGRQAGVQKVDVSLLDGKVDITPKEDGQIDPVSLLKATYDSGVSVAELDVTALGTVVKDASDGLALRIAPNRSFPIVSNEPSKNLEIHAGDATEVMIRGQLYKKPAGRKKAEIAPPLRLLILEVQRKE